MKHEELLKHIQQAIDTCFEYELVPYKDGNQWCVLYGENIQDGIVGFGDTRLDAMLEFKKEYDSYVKRTHLYPTQEQPVSEDLDAEIDRFYRSDEYKISHELGRGFEAIAYHFFDFGCTRTAVMYDDIEYNRQRAEEAKISKGLENEYQEFCKDNPFPWSSQYVNREYIDELCLSVARHFAEWQRKQDQSLIELAEDHAMLAGMNKMKEEMMEKAVDTEVVTGKEGDKWLVTYVGDYESMLKVCKTGDKVRVIVIKEEK